MSAKELQPFYITLHAPPLALWPRVQLHTKTYPKIACTRISGSMNKTHHWACRQQPTLHLNTPAPSASLHCEKRLAVVQAQNVQPLAPMATKGDQLAKLEPDRAQEQQLAAMVCSLENKEACMVPCSIIPPNKHPSPQAPVILLVISSHLALSSTRWAMSRQGSSRYRLALTSLRRM